MTILDYTDIPTVRALLGVNSLEIKDETVMLPPYVLAIEEHLDLLSPQVLVKYVAIKAVTPEENRSSLQVRFFYQVQTYSALIAAIVLMPSLPMAAPRSIEDGKAKLERIADPYTALEENLKMSARVVAQRILDTLLKLDPSIALVSRIVRSYAGTVPLAIDPVTNA